MTKANYVRYFEIPIAFFQLETDGLSESMPNPWNALNEAVKSVSPAGVNYAPITATLGAEIPFESAGDVSTVPFFVSPDSIELSQLEVDVPTPSFLYVTIGSGPGNFGLGSFEELNFPNPEAGQISELIQIDGRSPARRYY